MTHHQQTFIDALQEQHNRLVRTQQANLDKSWADVTAAIQTFDENCNAVERKYQKNLRESKSDAWTSDLHSLHAERKRKNDEARSQLIARLDAIPVKASIAPLDTEIVVARLSEINDEIVRYREILSIKRRQTEFLSDYGKTDNEKWIKEILRFIQQNPTVEQITRSLQAYTEELSLNVNWISIVAERINELIEPATALPDVEPSNGVAFEHACLLVLQNSGWLATLTPPTGDQGVDILAKKDDISVAIQCKNYRSPVGNGAVQEVHAGKSFYEADVAVVVSLSGYTQSASLLAKKLRVLLLDQILLNRLDELL